MPALNPKGRTNGRILAIKLGMNPNSSSLGVDVTFLLFGLLGLSMLVPVMGLVLRVLGVGRSYALDRPASPK